MNSKRNGPNDPGGLSHITSFSTTNLALTNWSLPEPRETCNGLKLHKNSKEMQKRKKYELMDKTRGD